MKTPTIWPRLILWTTRALGIVIETALVIAALAVSEWLFHSSPPQRAWAEAGMIILTTIVIALAEFLTFWRVSSKMGETAGRILASVVTGRWLRGLVNRTPKLPTLSRLRIAVNTSDTVALRKVLAANPNLLNYQDEKGATPLHWAAERQDLSVVGTLVDLGADTTVKDKLGYRPREVAYWYGEFRMGTYTDICQKIVERLNKSDRNLSGSVGSLVR